MFRLKRTLIGMLRRSQHRHLLKHCLISGSLTPTSMTRAQAIKNGARVLVQRNLSA
jgi:hypothetical protein